MTRAGTAGFLAIWIADPDGPGDHGHRGGGPGPGRLGRSPTSRRAGVGPYLGPLRRRGDGHRALLTAPARTNAGQLLGVVGVVLDVGPLVQLLTDPTGLGRSGEVLVGMQEGGEVRFLLPPRNAPRAGGYPPARVPAMALALAGRVGHPRDPRLPGGAGPDRLSAGGIPGLGPGRQDRPGGGLCADRAPAPAPVRAGRGDPPARPAVLVRSWRGGSPGRSCGWPTRPRRWRPGTSTSAWPSPRATRSARWGRPSTA